MLLWCVVQGVGLERCFFGVECEGMGLEGCFYSIHLLLLYLYQVSMGSSLRVFMRLVFGVGCEGVALEGCFYSICLLFIFIPVFCGLKLTGV